MKIHHRERRRSSSRPMQHTQLDSQQQEDLLQNSASSSQSGTLIQVIDDKSISHPSHLALLLHNTSSILSPLIIFAHPVADVDGSDTTHPEILTHALDA
jgi:hypothetical protein